MLQESLLRAVSFTPHSLHFPNAWVGHLPFAAWLMREWAPTTFVELGTHSGNSFFTFCQAVQEAGLPTRCFAIDTWKGDEHAQHYGEEVFEQVSRHHAAHYAAFARLVRTTFDDAVQYFADESVDLLHIDGLHTYDAVRYDFETWLPKLSPGAVVLFHDTNVRERDFGVWRLWLELEEAYPRHLEFVHSHGLGVLQLNNAPPGRELSWLVPGSADQAMVLRFFAAMSDWHLGRYDTTELRRESARLQGLVTQLQGQLADVSAVAAQRDQKIAEFRAGLQHRDGEIAWRDAELVQRRAEAAHLAALRNSRTWKLLTPAARLVRGVRRRMRTTPQPPAAEPGPDGGAPDAAALVDARWYLETYPDVRDAGVDPVAHYVHCGAREGRRPNPGVDATRDLTPHPAAAPVPPAAAPLAPPRPAIDIRECLPRGAAPQVPGPDVAVDIIIPVYKGYETTRQCLESVLADTDRPPGVIRVIDDCSPVTALSDWLVALAAEGRIQLIRNAVNKGFVATVNLGMAEAGSHDVVLLNSDTTVPSGFLRRLAAHAYATPRVGTVTPFSNYAGELCSYPAETGGPLPDGYSTAQLDAACQAANGGHAVEVPVGRGFCLYVQRRCLDEVGPFDEQAFGRGYGEESDFCLRAGKAGWRHLLACDTFVHHEGQVSFGAVAPERDASWHTLVARHPELPAMLERQRALAPTIPYAFAATAALFRASGRPTVLAVAHAAEAGAPVRWTDGDGAPLGDNVVLVSSTDDGVEVSVPSLPGHPVLRFPAIGLGAVLVYARACGVTRVDLRHWVGLNPDLRLFLQQLGVPIDISIHEFALG